MKLENRLPLFGQKKDEILSAVTNSKHKKELEFLYSTMPLSDVANYEPSLFEAYAEHGAFLRETVDWCKTLPEELYLNEVLYHRVNSEDLTACRKQFFDILYPLVQGRSMEEAAKIINYWCAEEATYRLTDDRTASPLTVLRCAFGRCGEESTFAVTALRSVGIPARQVYVPKWPHCDDNHAWVELYCDGEWHYLGACEPEEILDRGWFTAAASRAMLVHSRTFGDTMPGEEYIAKEGCMSLWNQLHRYADSVELTVTITEQGQPVSDVLVKAELLNYAQFSPIANQLTDQKGQVHLRLGLGDLHLHCVKEGRFLTKKIDLRKTISVELDFGEAVAFEQDEGAGLDFDMEAPKDNMKFIQPQREEVKLLRQKKFDDAAAKRHAKEAKFMSAEQGKEALLGCGFSEENAARGAVLLSKTYGNDAVVLDFLSMDKEQELRLALLESLTDKDLSDCTLEPLCEAFDEALQWKDSCPADFFAEALLCPRIGLETLSLWRKDLPKRFSEEEKARFRQNPREIGNWIKSHITYHEAEEYDELLTLPLGLLDIGSGSLRSQHILFVAICRSLGIAAHLAKDDGRPQYWNGEEFADGMPLTENGRRFAFTLSTEEKEPWLYTQNWTLARLENAQYKTLDLSRETWSEGKLSLDLLEGHYRLITCKRMPTGALFAKEYRFEVSENGENSLSMAQRQAKLTDLLSDKPIPDFTLYEADGTARSMAEVCAGRANLLLWLQEGAEPTEHILNEMEDLLEGFKALDAQIIFILHGETSKEDARIARALAHIPNIRVLYDDFRDTMSMLARRMYIDPDKLPIVALCSNGLNGIYGSSGYNVGLGDLILKIFNELK